MMADLEKKRDDLWKQITEEYEKDHPGKGPSERVYLATKAGFELGFTAGLKEMMKAILGEMSEASLR